MCNIKQALDFCKSSGEYRFLRKYMKENVNDMGVDVTYIPNQSGYFIEQIVFGCITMHKDGMGPNEKYQMLIPRWIKKGWKLDLLTSSSRLPLDEGQPILFNNRNYHCVVPRSSDIKYKTLTNKIERSGYLPEAEFAKAVGIKLSDTHKIYIKTLGFFVPNIQDRKWLKENTNTLFGYSSKL